MRASATKYNHQLTPEQLALSAQRKAKKLSRQIEEVNRPSPILNREWISLSLGHDNALETARVRILTWNLLAQCLVRREIFPHSDCLKASQREDMLHAELLSAAADVLCLQEVDRLEKLLPALQGAGYDSHYAAGPSKKHGCLVAFKKDAFQLVKTRLVEYDKETVRSEGTDVAQRGSSFLTRNIASLVLLQRTDDESKGVVVATTHLFWHPRYTYERARQAGILVREIARFRAECGRGDWSCVIAGDLNFAPDDAVYSLLCGDPLLPEQEECLMTSRVVHSSIDHNIPATLDEPDENNEDAVDPDRVIVNARPAVPSDGLLTLTELGKFYSQIPKLRSVYDEGLAAVKERMQIRTYSDRVSLAPSRHGHNEPEYTSYALYWKAVLDYIFILDAEGHKARISSLLSPHRASDLEPGIPRKGICGSDHYSLAAELEV